MKSFTINNRAVGEGAPCLVIAEMGLGHDGSLGAAHAFIDAAAETGADAVKFQTHIAEAEGTAEEAFRVNVFPQDATRQGYWKRTAFSEEQWKALKQRADEKGLLFLSSPFSAEAVALLQRVGVPAWKVASGETNNTPLLEALIATGLPILLSTGMSRPQEIDEAVRLVKDSGTPLLLFQCTNRYPCPPRHVGLNMLAEYRERYDIPVGFSDHSGRTAAAIAARTLGACAVEVHVTFSRRCFGPDVSASLTFEELAEAVAGIRFVDAALAAPVDKEAEAGDLADVRSLFTKSIVCAQDIRAGTRLTPDMLDFKKPGTGIPAAEYRRVVGKVLRRDGTADMLLAWEDLGDE